MPIAKPLEQHDNLLVDRVQYLSILNALGGDLDQVILDFLTDCERFARQLAECALVADSAGFREVCHEVKGASAILGFTGIANWAAGWSRSAKTGHFPTGEEVAGEFTTLVEATRQWFEDGP